MFDKKSRYSGVQEYQVTDRRGRQVTVAAVPNAPQQNHLGTHLHDKGQRLDHLAAKYLDNADGFWRICEHNSVMLPEALGEAAEIEIPAKR